jgi:glycosyltransferase involved in cell wall biosynthesis
MRAKTVLMACTNYWYSPFQVGSHHIAQGFMEDGWKVAFVSDPISPFHLLKAQNSQLKDRFALYRSRGRWLYDKRLWTYIPGTLVSPNNKPILRSGFVNREWQRLTWPNVISTIEKNGFGNVDLLYIDSAIQAFWLEAIHYEKAVFRVADNQAGFAKFTPEMQAIEKRIASSVDLVVYTARELQDHIETLQPKNMLHLPNGVNFKHFECGAQLKPDDLKEISTPIAIYVGAMDVWFDFELVNYAATELPNVAFVLIGPADLANSRLKHLPNIHVLGRRSYEELPRYLLNANVGIIPFNEKDYPVLVNSINPLKLYEYFACGLPVVSVAWKELYNLASPAILCQTADEFVKEIADTISKQNDKEVYKEYAKMNNWLSRVNILVNYLFKR